jgi:hypothetical protein
MRIQFDPGAIRREALVLPVPKVAARGRLNAKLRSVRAVKKLPVGLAETDNGETLAWIVLACSATAALVLSFWL